MQDDEAIDNYQTYMRLKRSYGEVPAPKTDWISTKDLMPPKDVRVLCFYYGEYMDVMEYWYDDEQTGKPNFFNPPAPPVDDVTHWMPLPEKPTS